LRRQDVELNLENLAKCTDAEFESIEKMIAKEKKRREKDSKIKAKLEKQANALGYTLAQKASTNPGVKEGEAAHVEQPPKEQPKEKKEAKPASEWSLGAYAGVKTQ
jgi:hypothetical protein